MDLWILDVPYLLAIYLSPEPWSYRYTNRRDAPLPGPSRLRRWRRWRRGGRQADGDGWHMEIQGEEVASADWWFHNVSYFIIRSNPNVMDIRSNHIMEIGGFKHVFSISYMGCHPEAIDELYDFSEG